MNFGTVVMNVLTIIFSLALLAVPYVACFLIFRWDKKKKISHLRFIPFVCTVLFTFVATIIFAITDGIFDWTTDRLMSWGTEAFAKIAEQVYGGRVRFVFWANLTLEIVFLAFVISLRKIFSKRDILVPASPDGKFTIFQKIERWILKRLNNEIWFLIGRVIFYAGVVFSGLYALGFVLSFIFVLFPAESLSYETLHMAFESTYLYPSITLILLWEAYYFLEGVKRINDECPGFVNKICETKDVNTITLDKIDEEVKRVFGAFYNCDVSIEDNITKEQNGQHNVFATLIGKAASEDPRNPVQTNESYLNCVDRLTSGDKSIVINGNIFSSFSRYFFRYLSIIVARGDNVVLVCNNDEQIDLVYDYVFDGMAQISSPYCKDFSEEKVNFDDPIWKIVKIKSEKGNDDDFLTPEKNILITSLNYLSSNAFEEEHIDFIPTISCMVFVDILTTLNNESRRLAILNTRLRHITEKYALAAKNGHFDERYKARYMSRQIRYICFDNTRVQVLDSVLKNLLAVDFEIADAMVFGADTAVRCYTYEPLSEGGENKNPQFFTSCTDVSAAVNVAVFCLSLGMGKVTIFADGIAHNDIKEMLCANAGQVSVNANVNNITINKVDYKNTDKSVVIVMDTGCNLPATIRKYITIASETPTLMLVFSKAALMRDYYYANLNSIWKSFQIEKVPVVSGTKQSVAQKILVKANAGGVYADEVMQLSATVPQFEEYVRNQDINSILKEILEIYGTTIKNETDLFRYFEFTSTREFDNLGKYKSTDKILLRRKGSIFDVLNGKDNAILVTSAGEIELSIPKNRISQNYITGQNLLHNGKIYHIDSIDFANGKIYGQLTVAAENSEVYRYLQVREYRMEILSEQVEYVFPTKHIVYNSAFDDVSVEEVFVSGFRAPMDVITKKYYDINPVTMTFDTSKNDYHDIGEHGDDRLARETYRRYGMMKQPGYSSDIIRKTSGGAFGEKGAMTMSLKIRGKFGTDISGTQSLAVVMLNEIIHTMFPSVADSVVVCAGCQNDDTYNYVAKKQPKLTLIGTNEEIVSDNEINILIIEDCSSELGVVSVLMSAGENILRLLFSEIFSYLDWYRKSGSKSTYLCGGLETEPDVFDFDSLYKLSKILTGDEKPTLRVEENTEDADVVCCTFCSARGTKDKDITVLDDGRKICISCARTLVSNDENALKKHLMGVRMFMESAYGIQFDDDCAFCFDSALQIKNMLRSTGSFDDLRADLPVESYTDDRGVVHVEHTVPTVNLSELIVRELTYIWQKKNLSGVPEQLAQGHAALVIVQYLRFINNVQLADTRTAFFESASTASGVGYRQMTQELINHPQFGNNPFKYMASVSGKNGNVGIITPPKNIPTDLKSDPYKPEQPDRTKEEVTYYYHTNIPEKKRVLYDILLQAICKHEKTSIANGYTFEEICEVFFYLRCDHPEIFWIETLEVCGDEIIYVYGADSEETARIKAKIDAVVSKYLAEVNDSMSAYDVALHFHTKLINSLDYEMLFSSLDEETDRVGIDYIRTICGPFLTGKAVCAGYAYAFQYLMQKCGIECTKISGDAVNEDGVNEKHAWNLIKIDGEYYYTDVTWDDSSTTVQEVKNTDIGFSYFCVTTDEILRTRKIKQMPVMPPICTAKKANYYCHNDLVLESYDENKLIAFTRNAAQNGSSAVTFKCSTKELFDITMAKLFDEDKFCFAMLEEAHKYNSSVNVATCIHSRNTHIFTITIHFKNK